MTNSEKPVVKIFGSDSCFHCLKCKQMCEAMQIEHDYLDIYKDPEAYAMFKRLFPEAEGIPQVLWEDEHIGGYIGLTRKIDEFITIINNYGEGEIQ